MYPTADELKSHALKTLLLNSLLQDRSATGTPGDGASDFYNLTGVYTPSALPPPPREGLNLFGLSSSGRADLAIMATDGIPRRFQRRLAEVQSYLWQPITESTASSGYGFSETTSGTLTARAVTPASATMLQRLRRRGHVSAATANSTANWRNDKLSYFRGNTLRKGGFEATIRFGVSNLTTTASDAKFFVGFVDSAAYVAAGDTFSAGTNFFGFLCRAGVGETTWLFGHGGASSRTIVTTTMPRPALNSVYEISLLAAPGATSVIASIRNLETDEYYEYNTAASADIPSPTQGLTFQVNANNGAATQAVGFDLVSVYAEVYGL